MESVATNERESWLRAELSASGFVSLATAAAALDVSEQTIRRDLRVLEERGLARRVRGGARTTEPVSFRGRARTRFAEKTAIARKLLDLVPPRGVVAFDSSSTMSRLATLMLGADDLTVVTNGLDTLRALEGKPGITPLLTGGRLDPRIDSFSGPIAQQAASSFAYRAFFLSVAAFDERAGGYEDTLDEAQIKRTFLQAADSVVVGVDRSKLGERSVAVSVRIDEADVVCTDLDADDARLAALAGAGRPRLL
ncbi:DeoR/GlpR family DNA-binding transcription regulator [Microbacterium sp. NPDC055683]